MEQSKLEKCIVLLSFAGLLSACATSPDSTATSNSNSAQQANSNSSQTVAQGTASDASPGVTPPAVQTIPPPSTPAQPQATVNGNPPKLAPPAANARVPKLIAPGKRLEFGKQPQDKTLIRAITIRNGGQALLNIESVTPS